MTGKFDNRINAVYQSLVEYKNTEKNPVAVVDGEINRIAADAEKRGMGGRVADVVKGVVEVFCPFKALVIALPAISGEGVSLHL